MVKNLNSKFGMCASIVTLVAVLWFAASMIVGSDRSSYLSSMFIAWGFAALISSFAAFSGKETKAARYAAIIFAAVYNVFIMMVYFAQLTTVHLSQLSTQAAQILDYQKMGLFFSYDLLGYGFMALSGFFIALTIPVTSKADKWLKWLLLIHGVFSVSCFVIPTLGIFHQGMAGGTLTGVLVLEFWCAYFTPICILSFFHFKGKNLPEG